MQRSQKHELDGFDELKKSSKRGNEDHVAGLDASIVLLVVGAVRLRNHNEGKGDEGKGPRRARLYL